MVCSTYGSGSGECGGPKPPADGRPLPRTKPRLIRALSAAAVLTLIPLTPARADGYREWLNACGGTSFRTCASVRLWVTGTTVRMRLRNLSGLLSSHAGTVFTSIGLENVPPGISAVIPKDGRVTTMSGPYRVGSEPAKWGIANDQQAGGGINLDLISSTLSGVDNGLASNCATSDQLPGGTNSLWMTTSCMPGFTQVVNGSANGGDLEFSFQVNYTWDPNTSDTYLMVKGQNGPLGLSTSCVTGGLAANCTVNAGSPGDTTVTPEPASMLLLGTGLAGLAAARRRRRERERSTG